MRRETCEYCPSTHTDSCAAIGEEGFACTREEGHDGEHVACGYEVHQLDVWEYVVITEV